MKKMLSTTLVAIAFAMVSTADAKKSTKAPIQTTNAPIQTTNAQAVREQAKNALQAEPKKENAQPLVDTAANDKAGIAIAQKEAKQLEVNTQKKLVASLGKTGWIFDGRTAEQKQAHQDATATLARLEQELKDINVDNDLVKKEVGISYYNAMLGTVIAAMAIGGISVLDDMLYQGKGKAALAPYYEAGKAKVTAAASRARAKAGSMYTTGKGYASDAYNKLPSMRGKAAAPVTAPQYNLPEYQ